MIKGFRKSFKKHPLGTSISIVKMFALVIVVVWLAESDRHLLGALLIPAFFTVDYLFGKYILGGKRKVPTKDV